MKEREEQNKIRVPQFTTVSSYLLPPSTSNPRLVSAYYSQGPKHDLLRSGGSVRGGVLFIEAIYTFKSSTINPIAVPVKYIKV